MTFKTFKQLRRLFEEYFYENGEGCEVVSEYRDVDMIVMDALAFVKGLRLNKSEATDDYITGRELLEKIFNESIEILTNTNVKIIVFCIDAFGRHQPEKAEERKQRKIRDIKKVAQGSRETLELKDGESTFFKLDRQLPGRMDEMMRCFPCKMDFYDFLTTYVTSAEFIAKIPPGKRFVFWGGITIKENREFCNVGPLQITRSGFQKLKGLDEKNIVEGDLAIWMFVQHYKEHKTVLVDSNDGDAIMMGLVQQRLEWHRDSTRSIWVKTRRASSEAGEEYDEETKSKHNERANTYKHVVETTGDKKLAYKMSRGITAQMTARRRVSMSTFFIDLTGLWGAMENYGLRLKELHDIEGSLFMPEEFMCVFGLLASSEHDYFRRSDILSGVSCETLVEKYIMHQHLLNPIVSLAYAEGKPNVIIYKVDVRELKRLVEIGFTAVAAASIKREGKTEEQYNNAVIASKVKRLSKIDERAYHTAAARMSWVLHYSGLQFTPDAELVDATQCKEGDLYEYGYSEDGFTDEVSLKDIYSCPPSIIPTRKQTKRIR
jgi:hypothetical protein